VRTRRSSGGVAASIDFLSRLNQAIGLGKSRMPFVRNRS
jgi:hypothetical protein